MSPDRSERLKTIHNQLIKLTQSWALRQKFDPDRARALRAEALLSNHAHYLENIPAYRRFAREEGIDRLDEIDPIKRRLMLPDDLFKSYDQTWLDERNFVKMNEWLSEVHHRRVDVDVAGAQSIDAWIERLGENDIQLVYSTGTSGNFSFIPRDLSNWNLFRTASVCYLTPLLMHEKVGTLWQRLLVKLACQLLPPSAFVKLSHRMGAADYDAVFLDFNRGRTGNQTLVRELAPLFRRHCFLYEADFSPSVLRLVTRGAKSEEDQKQLEKLQEVVVGRKEHNYCRVIAQIEQSTADGQKMFIFGTPYQYKELCETIAGRKKQIALNAGSLVLFGGGWKSFTGEKIPREKLIEMMSESFGLPPGRILEGYSMTEINAFMLRCDYGRFHIPPTIEPVIFDDELSPVEGQDIRRDGSKSLPTLSQDWLPSWPRPCPARAWSIRRLRRQHPSAPCPRANCTLQPATLPKYPLSPPCGSS